MDKVFLLGGSGKLGKQLVNSLTTKNILFSAPPHSECDIKNIEHLENHILSEKPNIIIHSAGFVDSVSSQVDIDNCIETNVIGTYNIIKLCRKYSIRLVLISSEYVFWGNCGEKYFPESPINPKNVYGISKGCSELLTKTLKDYLILRAPFIRDTEFPYPIAFGDQYTCRQYVDKILDSVIECAISKQVGIKHITGKYQSVYDLAKETKVDVVSGKLSDELKTILPIYLNLVEKDGNGE